MKQYFSVVLCSILLAGCNSSSSKSDSQGAILTGVFLDSAVSGLSYQTDSLLGVTNELGEFEYREGENITFSIGDLVFPTVPAEETITPISLSPSRVIEDDAAINIARLLQSLDNDNNPSNGISILDGASALSAPVDFSVPQDEFTQNAEVINLVANSGSVRTELLNGEIAISHLSTTLGISDFVRINTFEEYLDLVADRRQDRADSDDFTYSNSNSTITGMIGGDQLNGTWYWENGFFCRDGSFGDTVLDLDCQIVEISGNTLRGTRNQGNGDSVTVVLGETELDAKSKLAGEWRLNQENGCFEVLTFNSDNSVDIIDLGEIQGGTYSVSPEEVGNGRHSLNIVIVADNQEPGCDGETDSSVGNTFDFFIEFADNTVNYFSTVDSENSILQLIRP